MTGLHHLAPGGPILGQLGGLFAYLLVFLAKRSPRLSALLGIALAADPGGIRDKALPLAAGILAAHAGAS